MGQTNVHNTPSGRSVKKQLTWIGMLTILSSVLEIVRDLDAVVILALNMYHAISNMVK